MKSSHISALLTAILAGSLPSPSRGEGVVVQWERFHHGPGDGNASGGRGGIDGAGDVILAGTYQGHIYTAKYASVDGELLWDQYYNETAYMDPAVSAWALDGAGNMIVTGRAVFSPENRHDSYTAKYAAIDGSLLWEQSYNGPLNVSDYTIRVTLDSAGNVIVSGSTSALQRNGMDGYIAKYAAANGALLWEKVYGDVSVGEIFDEAVVDGEDNVIIMIEVSANNNISTSVLKYAGANGELLWSARHTNGPASSAVDSIAVDSAGNVIVSGASVDSSTFRRTRRTAKYSGANGARLWDKNYQGAAISYHGNWDTNLRVDTEGNVILTGIDYGNPSIPYIYTVKYAAPDGAQIWESRNATRGRIQSLVVDRDGNVITTGYVGSDSNIDIFTAKHRTVDLALLWSMQYNGTGNIQDFGDQVFVDDSGNVIVNGRTNGFDGFYAVKYAIVDLDLDDDGLPDSWEIEHFGGTAAHSALDDTDGDGAVELLELGFGTDPRASHSVPTPVVVIEDGYLTTMITKQPCVRYVVETGGSLESDFSAASTTVTETSTTLKVRDNVPVGTQPSRFLRVRVTAPPK